jgi:selenocysteine lyase/cysteine desulfurase
MFERLRAAVAREVNADHANIVVAAGAAHARRSSAALLCPSANLLVVGCRVAS